MAKITFSVIKADVGSIGGHTKPSEKMMAVVRQRLQRIIGSKNGKKNFLIDGLVTHTGDDICITMSHTHGVGAKIVHKFAWDCFMAATEVAKQHGDYASGQDILDKDKAETSGNVRGAGPGVAEIEFELLPKYRQAEAFLVFQADKCGPGAFNLALYDVFCNPRCNTGLILSPPLRAGFVFDIIDMDYQSKDSDRIISIDTTDPNMPYLDIITLLSDIDRYAVESIYSKKYPDEKIVSVAATRLHNIAKDDKGDPMYTGKDDPVMIVRTQKIFPAPEEVIEPFDYTPAVTGDCRGSHNQSLMPVAVNTIVRGTKCQPLVSCMAFSMSSDGTFTDEYVDMFAGVEWNEARRDALLFSQRIRRQQPFHIGLASRKELAYTGFKETERALGPKFKIRKNPQ